MQASMAMSRAATPVAAFTPAVRAPRRAQRVQMRVAAMEPPAAAEAEAAEPEVSSEELYRRFEEMIAQHDMAYSVGDRVRPAAAMCGAEASTCLPALQCRRRRLPLAPFAVLLGGLPAAHACCMHCVLRGHPRTRCINGWLCIARLAMPDACSVALAARCSCYTLRSLRCKALWCGLTSAARTWTSAASPPPSAPLPSWRWPTSRGSVPLPLSPAAGPLAALPRVAWQARAFRRSCSTRSRQRASAPLLAPVGTSPEA